MLGTFIWGMAFIAQSVGMETIGPFTFQAIRCMLGVIFLFLVTFFFDWKIGMRASLQKWKNKKLWISGIICGTALLRPPVFNRWDWCTPLPARRAF